MKKIIAKIASVITIISIIFCSNPLMSYAAPHTGLMTIEEFEKKMNELYSEYDSSFEVLDNNGIEFVTEEYVNEMYERAKQAFEESEENSTVLYSRSISAVEPKRVMPYPFSDRKAFQVKGRAYPLAYASFEFDVKGTIDAQYDAFMDVSWSGVYRSGAAMNFSSFSTANEEIGYPFGNTSCYITFDIYVDFSWTNPVDGMTLSESVHEYQSFGLKGTDY